MYKISTALRFAPEIFSDILGYERYYQVSNYGNVRSLDRIIKKRTGKTQFIKGRVLKQRINPVGYCYVQLGKNDTKVKFAIHQLVAKTFLDNVENKKTVNHINGIKTDNNVCNLEWATHSENLSHAYRIGLRKPVSLEAVEQMNYKRKLKSEQVVKIKLLLAEGNLTHKEIAGKFNVSRSTITEIKLGRRWKHINIVPLPIRQISCVPRLLNKTYSKPQDVS